MDYQLAAFADESSNDFAGQVAALKRNGISGLEIRNLDGKNVTQLTKQEARTLAEVLRDNGLHVWSVGSPIGKIGIGEDFAQHLELYRHTLELACEMGAANIRLFSFFMPQGEDQAAYKNLVLDRMAVFAEMAGTWGVAACHENEKGIYGDNAARCLEIHRAVPGLKAVFDPANFVQCGQDTLQAWEMLRSYVHYMHIKDALPNGRVVPPGAGHGHVPELIARYAAQGGRVLSLEPHLYEFVGLKDMEREDDASSVGGMAFATAEAAFDYASDNLKQILEGIL